MFVGLAGVCLAGAGIVLVLDRPPTPGAATIAVTVIQAALCLYLSRDRSDPGRVVAVVAMAALTAQAGYFFGPSSAFAAVVALGLVMTGVLSVARRTSGWIALAIAAGSQLAIVLLVVTDTIADRSLVPIIVGPHPMWHHVAAHLAIQGIFVAAFLAGRRAQARYRRIAAEVDDATQRAASREALLGEARADYERAIAIARLDEVAAGVRLDDPDDNTHSTLQDSPGAKAPKPVPAPKRATAERAATTTGLEAEQLAVDAWLDAHRSQMRGQYAFALSLCVGGAVLFGIIARDPTAKYVAWACMAGIAAAIALHRVLVGRGRSDQHDWPWVVVAVLAVGPAYSIGLHTGFAAIFATAMFAGGLFRAPQRAERPDRRLAIPIAVCSTHLALFVGVMTGVLGDNGNVPIALPGAPPHEPWIEHALVQSIFVAAFVTGAVVDRRFEHAFARARDAIREAARQDARLRDARAGADAALSSNGALTGATLGRWTLGTLRGRGGMGEVYEASSGDERAAIKVVRRDRLADPVALERFGRETQVLMRVDSPSCARVVDVGLTADPPYVATELVAGPSLSAILRTRERLPADDVAALVGDLARGLRDVHAAGVVHLDIKPSNILHAGDGATPAWRLVDFGVARLLAATDGNDPIAGTPQYMAPEQAAGERVDTRSDLYSLSLVIYRALVGRPAFAGTDRAALVRAARDVGPPDPRPHGIDDGIATCLRIGLAFRPEDRFATATELQKAFAAAFSGTLDDRLRDRGRALLERAPWAR
jgi:hypothetical protein